MKIDLGKIVGADGKSAYQIAVEHGFEGTEQEWIDSLNYDDDIFALDEKINQEITDRTNADTEIDTKLNSPLPWKFNYLSTGYSKDLQYRKIGEGYCNYSDNMNWSFYSEIEMIHHSMNGVFERGTIFVSLRGNGSTINVKRVSFHSLSGGNTNLSKTKINYKIDTTNKRIYLEILAYCQSNYTNILFRNSLTRNADMLFNAANNFWTFAANQTYIQSSTTMQAGVTSEYTEVPLSVVSVDKNGNDIVNTYATKTELSEKADSSHTHDDRYYTEAEIDTKLNNKVDKVSGKGLSTNDYTTAEKNKLAGLSNYDDTSLKTLINGKADSSHTHDDRYYTESEIDTKLNEKLNKNAPSVSIKHYAVKNTDSSYKNMWTKIASCKFTRQYNIASLSLEITQSRTTNNANSFWKGHVHFYTQNELTKEPIYSFICTEKTGHLAEDCIKILIHKLTDTNGNAYLQCEMYLKSPNVTWVSGYYIVLVNQNWSLFTNQDYVSELPSADVVLTPTFTSKASHDKDGNDIVDTYATKTELFSHTHSEYHSKTDLNIKNYGFIGGTRYIEISSFYTFAGVEVDIAYSGKWYFATPGSAPLYFGGDSYTGYGVSGWAWSSDKKKLYLKISLSTSDYKPVSISVLGANANDVSISGDSMSAPSGITFNTNTYDIKAEIDGKADSSHTHSEYHSKTSHNVKDYGSPYGTTRYVEISSGENFAGVEVNVAYSGKWYFSNPGSEPLYLGYNGATYNNYGLTGWAWNSDNTKLYLRFQGYRGVSVSALGAAATTVKIGDWTTTAPDGITFQTGEYDIKAEIDNLASANAGMSVSAKNVMEATGSIDFNTNKAILQLPIYSAEAAYYPTEQGAMWIQEVKEGTE